MRRRRTTAIGAWRAKRASCGEDAIDEAFEWALSQADRAGRDRVLITGKTHLENEGGQDLTRRTGFDVFRKDDGAIWWQQQIRLV